MFKNPSNDRVFHCCQWIINYNDNQQTLKKEAILLITKWSEIYQSWPTDMTIQAWSEFLFPKKSPKMADSSRKGNGWLSRVSLS